MPKGIKIIPPRHLGLPDSTEEETEPASSSVLPEPKASLRFRGRLLKKKAKAKPKTKAKAKTKARPKGKAKAKAVIKKSKAPRYRRGKRPFRPEIDSVTIEDPGEEAHNLFLLGLEIEAAKAGVHFSGKGDGEADNGLCIRQESRSSGEGSGTKEGSCSKEGVRGTCSGEAKGLQVWLGSQSASEGLASIRVPTRDTFEATLCHSSKGCNCISDERAGPPGSCYAAERVGGSSGSGRVRGRDLGKVAIPCGRAEGDDEASATSTSSGSSEDLSSIRNGRGLAEIAGFSQSSGLSGASAPLWTMDSESWSAGVFGIDKPKHNRGSSQSGSEHHGTTAAPRALPPPPPAPSSFGELLLDLPPPPAVPGTGTTPPTLDLPTPPPVPKAASAPIVAKPKPVPVKKMPVAAKAGEVVPIWSDSDRE